MLMKVSRLVTMLSPGSKESPSVKMQNMAEELGPKAMSSPGQPSSSPNRARTRAIMVKVPSPRKMASPPS